MAYVVARVSTDDQVNGQSMTVQFRNGKSLAKSEGFKRIKCIREAGVSANGPRPKLEAVLNGLKPGDALIVDDLSRLSRNGADARRIGKRIKAAHARLLTCREGIDSQKTNWCCIAAVCEVLLKREGDVLKGKRLDGRHMKAEQGLWAGGATPYGYRKEGKDLAIEPKEAEAVREIYERSPNEHKLSDVVKYLRSSPHKTKRGGLWRPKTVGDILANPINFGCLIQILDGRIYVGHREDLKIIQDLSIAGKFNNIAWYFGART